LPGTDPVNRHFTRGIFLFVFGSMSSSWTGVSCPTALARQFEEDVDLRPSLALTSTGVPGFSPRDSIAL
jgi:hypothetical protein